MTNILPWHDAIAKRRTFAIIAHPDAGKTTLTEKLLLYGGAVRQAGDVRARGENRRTRSDNMKIERERGISVSASAMCFVYNGHTFNLLDTPGHEDFSEDTYRTLTAADSAIMVLDAAKGIEAQTRKLFEVCRLRDIPITTFINKMDREAMDPLVLLDDIASTLALDVAPITWPLGQGAEFIGSYRLDDGTLTVLDRAGRHRRQEGLNVGGLEDDSVKAADLPFTVRAQVLSEFREQVTMVRAMLPTFNEAEFLGGRQTPVFFGSALQSFGIQELLDGLIAMAPAPRPQPCAPRSPLPTESNVSGFVFKIQANTDPKHRDRVAFVRLMSGQFERGMKLHHVRTGKSISVTSPMLFAAEGRETADMALAGDIIGVPNHGTLRIGDVLSQGENLRIKGIPAFAPEILQAVRTADPLKSGKLTDAVLQLAEEGVGAVFKTRGGSLLIGAVGALQFDVMRDRLMHEYGIPAVFEETPFNAVRWISGCNSLADVPADFAEAFKSNIGTDYAGRPVLMARSSWDLTKAARDFAEVILGNTVETG